MTEITNKKYYIEILRIIAIIGVIFNHTQQRGFVHFTCYEPGTPRFYFYMVFSVLSGISVPIFFMISGLLLLNKDESLGQLWKRRILKYICVLVFFSLFYYLLNLHFDLSQFSLSEFALTVYSGNVIVPFWFLYIYIAYLIMLPFIRKLVIRMTVTDFLYLMALYLFFNAVLAILQFRLTNDKVMINSLIVPSSLLQITVFYPVIGYYCGNIIKTITKKHLAILFSLFILSVVLTIYITGYMMITTGDISEENAIHFYDSTRPFQVIFIFLLVRKLFENRKIHPLAEKAIITAGSCVFGIYLIEETIRLSFYSVYDYLCTKMNSFIAILIYVLFVFIYCLMIVALFKFLKRMILKVLSKNK